MPRHGGGMEIIMNIVCLDLEGVLVPEIWIAFAKESGISELSRTTRDEPDYDKLMKWRLSVLREHGITLKDIQATIAAGDSFNDLGINKISKAGFLFRSTERIKKDYPQYEAFESYDDLLAAIKKAP